MRRIEITNEKLSYINFLNRVKPFIKLSYFCNQVGINQATLSKLLSDSKFYTVISEDNLSKLCSVIVETCDNVMWI